MVSAASCVFFPYGVYEAQGSLLCFPQKSDTLENEKYDVGQAYFQVYMSYIIFPQV